MQEFLIRQIGKQKIYPIIRENNPETVVDMAKALFAGGLNLLEITIENDFIYDAIEEISDFATVAAGGIITEEQAVESLQAGAKILSAPVFQMNMVKISKDKKAPLIASVTTSNEAYTAWKTRVPLMKVFPASALGGKVYIEDLLRPMPFLNLMPSGGIALYEVCDYLKAGAFAVGVGRGFYEDSTFDEITKKAKDILKKIGDLSLE
jgi:2-dehydro-3-deoxyphosphogluconate aldolase/(4S)-4-hydroxy-2-oxoglutarate aldolase